MFVRVYYLFSCLLTIVANCGVQALLKDRSFAEAQCIAKCLQSFALKVNAAFDKHRNDTQIVSLRRTLVERPDLMLAQCSKQTTLFPFCRSCVKRGCKANPRTMRCTDVCKSDKGCIAGCQHLQEVTRNRPGSCPTARPPLAHEGSCFRRCSTDADCRLAQQKCCRSGCNSRCSTPVYNASIPRFDQQMRIWEHKEARKIDVEWRIKEKKYSPTDYLNPMIFVAQIRDYKGVEFDDRFARSWANLAISTVTGASLDEVQVGVWYQFRVAAVTATGTRGFRTISTPVQLSLTPRPPTAPRNVSDGVWRIHASGSIHVQINWSPPEICDIHLTRYQVEWVQDHGYVQSDGKSLEALTRFKQYVPADLTSYTIENLLPSTSYKVQVTAYARWGRSMMKSPPNTLFITTPQMWSPKDAARSDAESNKKANGEDGRCVCDQKTPGLFIYKPVYRNGSLDVKILLTKTTSGEDKPYLVEWSPKVCIATSEEARVHKIGGRMKSTMQGRVKMIKDLAFNCRYWLRLSPLETPDARDVISTCFCTPSCRDVNLAKGTKPPRCSPDNSLPVPSRPTNINARKVGRQEFALTWARPKRERYFNRFRVVWGPREEEPVNKDMYGDSGLSPKIDFNLAETKVVSNNVTSLRLKNLRDATMYIVKIQALTYRDGRESESPEGVLYFTTDGFTNPPTVEDYQAVVRQYVKNGRPNGISCLAPPARSLFLLLHFLNFLRDFT